MVSLGFSVEPKRRNLFCTNGAPVPCFLESCSEINAAPTAVLEATDWSSVQLLSVLVADIASLVKGFLLATTADEGNFLRLGLNELAATSSMLETELLAAAAEELGLKKLATSTSLDVDATRNSHGFTIVVFTIVILLALVGCSFVVVLSFELVGKSTCSLFGASLAGRPAIPFCLRGEDARQTSPPDEVVYQIPS